MAGCQFCGGLGRVAPGGITGQLAATFGADVHPCRQCRGTGRAGPEGPAVLPAPRPPLAGRVLALPGEWRVEIHGSGRILAVLGFVLTAHRFEARSDYGGPLGWQAEGEWTRPAPGNVIRFTGTQSSPYLLTTDYRWGATLEPREHDLLHGQSVAGEWTTWSRTAAPASEAEVPAPAQRIEHGAH
ncbi:hypothetical protein [Actinophytocola sp.]|uniref:hypothetical protein n=1 Tax=Actinophytocola sp. TaxID=1872138 RepID=UPI002D80A8AE|nr:hypothetical protein [Actinophytocola sp.]HET9139926.1 hypothetical protein [Actinophytocola sp.]